MKDFICKARLVERGHMTKALATIMYRSIVSRETVRIALMVSTLSDLLVKLGSILNAYFQAPVTEKVWTTLGLKSRKNTKRTAVIFPAIYGLKLASAAFRSHLAKCMESLGYEYCKAEPDLWLQPEIRPEDGVKCYSYLLCYVDDVHQSQTRLHARMVT